MAQPPFLGDGAVAAAITAANGAVAAAITAAATATAAYTTVPVITTAPAAEGRPAGNNTNAAGANRKKGRGNWTHEEDELLRATAELYGGKKWKDIAQAAFGDRRSAVQCRQRWKSVLDRKLVKGKWTPEEDSVLEGAVNEHGPKNWSKIALLLPGRLGKQCRERWFCYLSPDISLEPWTEEEEEKLIEAHQLYGNQWARIKTFLPGRTDNSIKNHFHILQNRMKVAGTKQAQPRWTVEEEVNLVTAYKVFGKDWDKIADMLPGRSAVAVHNHFNVCIRKLETDEEVPQVPAATFTAMRDKTRRERLVEALGSDIAELKESEGKKQKSERKNSGAGSKSRETSSFLPVQTPSLSPAGNQFSEFRQFSPQMSMLQSYLQKSVSSKQQEGNKKEDLTLEDSLTSLAGLQDQLGWTSKINLFSPPNQHMPRSRRDHPQTAVSAGSAAMSALAAAAQLDEEIEMEIESQKAHKLRNSDVSDSPGFTLLEDGDEAESSLKQPQRKPNQRTKGRMKRRSIELNQPLLAPGSNHQSSSSSSWQTQSLMSPNRSINKTSSQIKPPVVLWTNPATPSNSSKPKTRNLFTPLPSLPIAPSTPLTPTTPLSPVSPFGSMGDTPSGTFPRTPLVALSEVCHGERLSSPAFPSSGKFTSSISSYILSSGNKRRKFESQKTPPSMSSAVSSLSSSSEPSSAPLHSTSSSLSSTSSLSESSALNLLSITKKDSFGFVSPVGFGSKSKLKESFSQVVAGVSANAVDSSTGVATTIKPVSANARDGLFPSNHQTQLSNQPAETGTPTRRLFSPSFNSSPEAANAGTEVDQTTLIPLRLTNLFAGKPSPHRTICSSSLSSVKSDLSEGKVSTPAVPPPSFNFESSQKTYSARTTPSSPTPRRASEGGLIPQIDAIGEQAEDHFNALTSSHLLANGPITPTVSSSQQHGFSPSTETPHREWYRHAHQELFSPAISFLSPTPRRPTQSIGGDDLPSPAMSEISSLSSLGQQIRSTPVQPNASDAQMTPLNDLSSLSTSTSISRSALQSLPQTKLDPAVARNQKILESEPLETQGAVSDLVVSDLVVSDLTSEGPFSVRTNKQQLSQGHLDNIAVAPRTTQFR